MAPSLPSIGIVNVGYGVMTIKGYRLGPLLMKTGKEIINDNILGIAAGVAYNFFFSIFPTLLFAAPLIGLIGNEQRSVNWVMTQLATVVPTDAIDLVQGVVRDVVFSPSAPGLVSVGAVLAAWSGSGVFRTLMGALNTAYHVQEARSWLHRAWLSVAAIIATGLLLLIASTIMLAGPEIAKKVGNTLHLGEIVVIAWTVLQYPLAVLLVIAAFYQIYRFMPSVKQDRAQLLVGATIATFLWLMVTLGFRLYVANFGSYNKTYGTIGAVIVLLTWLYLTSVVILAGGELNSEIHSGTGREPSLVRRPTAA